MSIQELDAQTPGAPEPPERPVVARLRPLEWTRENLFSTWYNSLLTVVFGALLLYAIYRALRYVFVTARWEIIQVNLTNLMVGLFPRDDLLRPWVALFLIAGMVGLLAGRATRTLLTDETGELHHLSARESVSLAVRRFWPIGIFLIALVWLSGSLTTTGLMLLLLVDVALFRTLGVRAGHGLGRALTAAALVLLVGAFGTLLWFDGVGWDDWGGLLLTLFLAAAGILLSFPIGVLLALGRRSTFPAVRTFCVGYIELIRGVPLITILFMASLMIGFFFPPGFQTPSRTTRAIMGLTIFTAAYVAEIVRGGLQAVPRGQMEAAQALGLPPVKQTRLIVLPQALRAVIPAMVGQFISLFKDTSLVVIVGLFDLLAMAQNITRQPRFQGQGLGPETLVFASFVYWVFAYTMSRESQRLEKRLGVGER